MPYPNSTFPKSIQLRLYNYSAVSMGWNTNSVKVRLLTIMFMLLGLGKEANMHASGPKGHLGIQIYCE